MAGYTQMEEPTQYRQDVEQGITGNPNILPLGWIDHSDGRSLLLRRVNGDGCLEGVVGHPTRLSL